MENGQSVKSQGRHSQVSGAVPGKVRITVIGVGGAGSNAAARMAKRLRDARVVCVNTDQQALNRINNAERIVIGRETAGGLGSGGDPDVGRRSAEEDVKNLEEAVAGADMVFIAAGMGGGTGTGAAPVIARLARRTGALTVGVVNMPFEFEGDARARLAREGLKRLEGSVDTLLALGNDRLVATLEGSFGVDEAFARADEVLGTGVRAIAGVVSSTGTVNLDFADLRAALKDGGRGHMAIAEATGKQAGRVAAEAALESPLIDGLNLQSATRAIVNVSGGLDLTLGQVTDAVSLVRERLHKNANIFMGVTRSEVSGGAVSVTLIATGMKARKAAAEKAAPPVAEPSVFTPLPAVAGERGRSGGVLMSMG
ncbi:MAG: cell division protein FtsZ [Dehalococcoidia bacterium]